MVLDELRVDVVPIDFPEIGQGERTNEEVEFGVVVWAEAQNVTGHIRAVVPAAERVDVVGLGVTSTTREYEDVLAAADLAPVVMQTLDIPGQWSVPEDAVSCHGDTPRRFDEIISLLGRLAGRLWELACTLQQGFKASRFRQSRSGYQ